jgi:hypothetical protein
VKVNNLTLCSKYLNSEGQQFHQISTKQKTTSHLKPFEKKTQNKLALLLFGA